MKQIECKHLNVKYDNNMALKDVSFDINVGDYICIIGENGSGKSTLIKAILGLINIKSGKVIFDKNLKKTEIGYLSQQSQVQKNFPASVLEVVLSGFISKNKFFSFYTKQQKQLAINNMKCLKIDRLVTKSYQHLSGGEQQRVLLARALSATSKIIFMDEPVASLDPIATKEFYEVVEHLNKVHGITIVTTSHDVVTATKYANKILHLHNEVVFFGSTKDYLEADINNKLIGSDYNDHN
jgi:zinc transport system ATP-binding protein